MEKYKIYAIGATGIISDYLAWRRKSLSGTLATSAINAASAILAIASRT